MTYQHVTYTRDGIEHNAIAMSWGQVEKVLGHKHEGNPNDDETIIRHLDACGAPDWVLCAEGEIDGENLYLIGPEMQRCECCDEPMDPSAEKICEELLCKAFIAMERSE